MTSIIALHHQSEQIIGELNNEGRAVFWDDLHVQGLDGEHHYEFKMPANIKEAEYFDELARILVPLEDGGFEEFIIYETEVNMRNEKTIYAMAAYTDMDKDILLNVGKYSGTLREMVAYALPSTEWQVVAVESNAIRTLHLTEPEGAYSFLMKVASLFEMEMQFRIHTSGNRISGRQVDFVQRVGFDTRKEIEYGKDLIGIEKKVFSDRIVTALHGIGPEKDDGTRLTSYIEDDEAFQRWNRRGMHRIAKYEPESDREDMTQAQLNQYTRTELNKRIASVVEYTITAAAIENIFPHEKVRLGDRVRVKNPEFTPPLYADARIIRVERSIVDKSKKTYTIGEVTTYSEEDILRTYRALQRVYGVKMIKAETAPDGQPKTIWINVGTPLNTPHIFNSVTNQWEKFAPTNAAEIGGIVVGQQYNGVAITPQKGLTVDRTDGLVKTEVNATEGISIQSRTKDTGTYQKVFYADETGKLTLKGIDIVRDDGYKVVNNGMLTFDLNVQGVEPPFYGPGVTEVQRSYGRWYSTRSTTSLDLNQYGFKHQGRYLKISYRVLAGGGNTAFFEIWRNGEIVASAYTAQTDEYSPGVLEGYTLTVDLGVPTGLPSTFALRLRSTVQGTDAYAMIRGKWLEG